MSDYFKELMEKHAKLDRDIDRIRVSARDAIHKITILSSGIVAFSVTLVSLDFLNTKIDLQTLYYSWLLFLLTIALGFLILEPRIEHAKRWRSFLSYSNASPEEMKNVSFTQSVKVNLVLLKCLLRPENIYLDELPEPGDEKIRRERGILSLVLVHRLAIFRQLILFWTENIFFVLFIASLTVFISSFNLN